MSKKKERVQYLVGIRNAINNPVEQSVDEKACTYDKKVVVSLLKTLDHLLAEDGVFPMSADSKVNG